MRLSGSALTSSPVDQELYVSRLIDARLERLLQHDDTTILLLVERGAGVTSLLNRLGDRIPSVLVDTSQVRSAVELVNKISSELGGSARATVDSFTGIAGRLDPFASSDVLLRNLRLALERASGPVSILLDGPLSPEVAFDLFGRHRDAVRALRANWVVTGFDLRAGDYLTPPADVFFDHTHDLPALDLEAALDLLLRRGADEFFAKDVVLGYEAASTQPRALIQRARRLDAEDLEMLAPLPPDLTSTERQILDELASRPGPMIATDPDLLRRLGVTDRTIRRSLVNLEQRRLVRQIPSSTLGPGRPAATYVLA